MNKYWKKWTAALISIAVLVVSIQSVFAAPDDVIIRWKEGRNYLEVNQQHIPIQKPFSREGTLYIPLRSVLEAMGAEVVWLGDGKIRVDFRQIDLRIQVNSQEVIYNGEIQELEDAPRMENKTVMIPAELLPVYFDAQIDYNSDTGMYTLQLPEDGSLTDFSFLTGNIPARKIGNSYYQWSLQIPPHSRMLNSSFNSKEISILNEYQGMIIDVNVENYDFADITELYDAFLNFPSLYLGSDVLEEELCTLEEDGGYAQFVYADVLDEPVCMRVYLGEQGFLTVAVTGYLYNSPDMFFESGKPIPILDSFSAMYDNTDESIYEISNIKDGMAEYTHFMTFYDEVRYQTWSVLMDASWDMLDTGDRNPLHTRMGTGGTEYLDITLTGKKPAGNFEAYAEKETQKLLEKYSPLYMKEIAVQKETTGKVHSFSTQCQLTMGNTIYMYQIRYISAGSFIYRTILKVPWDQYSDQEEYYRKIVSSLQFQTKKNMQMEKDVDVYLYRLEKSKIGKDTTPTDFYSPLYGWSLQVPGNWVAVDLGEGDFVTFLDDTSDIGVFVETVENEAPPASGTNKEENTDMQMFTMLSSMMEREDAVLLNTVPVKEKNTDMTQYTFRVDNAEDELFSDVYSYVIHGTEYSYCVTFVLPDAFQTEKNSQMMKAIWNSFTWTEQGE